MSRQLGRSESRSSKRKAIYVDPQDRSPSRDSERHPRKRRTGENDNVKNRKEQNHEQDHDDHSPHDSVKLTHQRKQRSMERKKGEDHEQDQDEQSSRALSNLPIPKPIPDRLNGRKPRREQDRMAEYNGLQQVLRTPIRGRLLPIMVKLDFETSSENGKVDYTLTRVARYRTVETTRSNATYEQLYKDTLAAGYAHFDEEKRHVQGKILSGEESTDESDYYNSNVCN